MRQGYALTPFSHLPGDLFTGSQRAKQFSEQADGPVTVVIQVNQWRGLPGYVIARSYWSNYYEQPVELQEIS